MSNTIYQQVHALDPRSPGVQLRDAIVGLVGVVLLFSCLATLPTRDFSSASALNGGLLSVFLLISGAVLIVLITASARRAHETAFSSWLNLKKPSLHELARIVFSPEEHSSIKDRVREELKKSHPNWRTQVAGAVAMRQGETGDRLPSLGYGAADVVYMVVVMSLGLIGFALALFAFTSGNPTLSISAMVCMGALMLFITRRNKKDQAKYKQWKVDVLATYSVVELIYLQALPNLTPEVATRLHRVLGEEMPGWSHRADVPLWAALCKCD
jgi:hypothetical protein